jgi:hypothetical protein
MFCIVWVVSGMNLYRCLVISQQVLFTESTLRKSESFRSFPLIDVNGVLTYQNGGRTSRKELFHTENVVNIQNDPAVGGFRLPKMRVSPSHPV